MQVDEDKKNHDRMHDLVEKLQAKLKTYKRQVEEAVILIIYLNKQKCRIYSDWLFSGTISLE